jgi:hypothetical protein
MENECCLKTFRLGLTKTKKIAFIAKKGIGMLISKKKSHNYEHRLS